MDIPTCWAVCWAAWMAVADWLHRAWAAWMALWAWASCPESWNWR